MQLLVMTCRADAGQTPCADERALGVQGALQPPPDRPKRHAPPPAGRCSGRAVGVGAEAAGISSARSAVISSSKRSRQACPEGAL